MQGKTVVMTGGTSGVGLAGAEELARRGARVVLVARDPARTAEALVRLRRAGPGAHHAVHLADLSDLGEMRRAGTAVAEAEPKVDVLVNNAGAWFHHRVVTRDGLEKTFALNHLSYAVMCDALRGSLAAAAPSRIVNTSSDGHRFAQIDWDDLQAERGYGGFKAYCRSKLCNVLFTREIARRLAGSGITANCFHPGFVASRFGDNNAGPTRTAFTLAKSLFAISPEKGARTLVHLACAPEIGGETGGYYAKSRRIAPARAARDDGAARRLWDITGRLIERTGA